jgi:lipoprotein-anchoring transpeptidase ErfK/SrfK
MAVSAEGWIRARWQTTENHEMNSRSVAGVVISATLGCGIAAFNGAGAKAQNYYPDRDAGPFQRMFGGGGYGGYSGGGYGGYPMRSSPIPRTMVSFPAQYRPGNIVIDTGARRLYLVTAPGEALAYGIGVGRAGFTWSGTRAVTMKREWPDWTPPSQMLRRRPDLPRHMVGGIDNPLGARALYLGSSLYRIHGSNEPETIGQAVSSGCFRMTNEDVIDLYGRVHVGTKVTVLR